MTIPAALLAAAVATRVLLARTPSDVAIALAQPVPVVNGWGALGAAAFVLLALALAVAFAAYAHVVVRGAPVAGLRSPASVGALCAFGLACAWAAPAVFSSDVYAYAAYGELARMGSDPYAHALLPHGVPLFDAAIVQWGNPPPACVYGLPFVWLSAGVIATTAAIGAVAGLDGLRLVSSLALVACGLLAYVAYRGDRAARLTAAATVALNPAALWCAAEGHNDALALAIVLSGITLARLGATGVGAYLAACAGCIKLPALLGGGPAATGRRGWAGAALGAGTALAASAPAIAGAVAHLAPHARYAPQASLQAVVYPLMAALLDAGTATRVTWGIAAAAAAACGWTALRTLRRGDREGWAYAALGGWLLLPNPYPWYGLWLAAIAAGAPKTRAALTLLALTLASLLRYLPDAVFTGTPAPQAWLGVAATLPYLLLFVRRPLV